MQWSSLNPHKNDSIKQVTAVRPALTEATSTTARGGTPGSDPEKRHAMLSFRMGRTEFLQCSKRFSVICRDPGGKWHKWPAATKSLDVYYQVINPMSASSFPHQMLLEWPPFQCQFCRLARVKSEGFAQFQCPWSSVSEGECAFLPLIAVKYEVHCATSFLSSGNEVAGRGRRPRRLGKPARGWREEKMDAVNDQLEKRNNGMKIRQKFQQCVRLISVLWNPKRGLVIRILVPFM